MNNLSLRAPCSRRIHYDEITRIIDLDAEGKSDLEIAKMLGTTRQTVWRHLKKLNDTSAPSPNRELRLEFVEPEITDDVMESGMVYHRASIHAMLRHYSGDHTQAAAFLRDTAARRPRLIPMALPVAMALFHAKFGGEFSVDQLVEFCDKRWDAYARIKDFPHEKDCDPAAEFLVAIAHEFSAQHGLSLRLSLRLSDSVESDIENTEERLAKIKLAIMHGIDNGTPANIIAGLVGMARMLACHLKAGKLFISTSHR